MTDKRKRAARAIMAETGWNYVRALREADRRHAEQQKLPFPDHDSTCPVQQQPELSKCQCGRTEQLIRQQLEGGE